jgi:hypothetical protein
VPPGSRRRPGSSTTHTASIEVELALDGGPALTLVRRDETRDNETGDDESRDEVRGEPGQAGS